MAKSLSEALSQQELDIAAGRYEITVALDRIFNQFLAESSIAIGDQPTKWNWAGPMSPVREPNDAQP